MWFPVLAFLMGMLAAGCATAPAPRPPKPTAPKYEDVELHVYRVETPDGACLKEAWVIKDPPAFRRNEARRDAYIAALERAWR